MDLRNRIAPLAAVAAALVLGGCQTTITRGGAPVTEDEARAIEAAEESGGQKSVDLVGARIGRVLDGLETRHGAALLKDLQYLVGMKELAIEPILERLPEASARTQANLIYVLGHTRTQASRQAIVERLDATDPVVRFEAAAALLQQGEVSVVPVLVGYLESEDRQFRFKAIEALRLHTGKDFGYRFAAPAPHREEAVARWKDWWTRERSRLMVRPAVASEED